MGKPIITPNQDHMNHPERSQIRFSGKWCWPAGLLALLSIGCSPKRDDIDTDHTVQQVWEIDDVAFGNIVQFEEVFWEPDDTISLREMIRDDALVDGRNVLEIGTGTGLIAIVSLQNGADRVVATDINPAAIANARYNAAVLGCDKNLECRQVSKDSPGAFDALKDGERFDVILSNPPWEDGTISKDLDHAFYDPGFALMDSLLVDLPQRLRVGGRCFLVYGHVAAIERLQAESKKLGYETTIHDPRKLSELPPDFLPGMLIEVKVKPTQPADSDPG